MRTLIAAVLLVLSGCGDKTPEDTQDTVPEDTAPEVTWAEVEVENATGYNIFYLYQCEADGYDCTEMINGTLLDGQTFIFQVEPGRWVSHVVDEDRFCVSSEEYVLYAGDRYPWRVLAMTGKWNGSMCMTGT